MLNEIIISNCNKATGSEDADSVRGALKEHLSKYSCIIIDLSNTRSLSPSFAYNVFGKLYDDLKEDFDTRVRFINDNRSLKVRIDDAILRRIQVLKNI
jgi:hypothetical protein